MNAENKILKARTSLILDHPFFGCLVMKLNMIESREFQTAATNGKVIFYNPEFIESLSLQEVIGLLAHEVMHIALGHMWRQENRELKKWNVATDYTINYNLEKTGFSLPEGGLTMPNLYQELSAEEIYGKLPDNPQGGGGSGSGNQGQDNIDPGGYGAVIPIEGENPTKEISEIKAAINQALQVSQGSLPQELEREIKETLETKVPWYVLLRDMIEMSARNDFNWNHPSPRYLSSGIVLPGLISEEIPEVVIAIDTSASITEEQLSIFAAESSAVLGAYDTTVRVIYCDARIQGEDTFTRADLPLELKLLGGGGTKFAPVFEHVQKQGYSPSCLIYFTDLAGSFPELEPDYPVMWLVPKPRDGVERDAPFGAKVKF